MSSDGQGSVSPPRDADDNRGVKNKFSGNLKHELRTPLNHIIGYCEMLMEQAQDDGLDIFLADLNRRIEKWMKLRCTTRFAHR